MITVTTVTKTQQVRNNRKKGKKYEGELVKILKEKGFGARLGRSNEEGDIILSDLDLIIECKSTSRKGGYRVSKNPAQYFRLRDLPQEVWFAIRWKGQGISGWRFYPIPDKIRVLFRSEGYTLEEFIIMKRPKEVSNAIQ